MLHPQPQEPTIHEAREPVEGACDHCGAETLARYRVADYQGWLRAVKCQTCLRTKSSERIPAPAQEMS